MQRFRVMSGVLGIALLIGSALPAFAATQSKDELIKQLQDQIAVLQARIQELRTAQTNVQSARQDVASTARLLVALREGMSGDDVKVLQAALAADADIYPEGLITGYYGKLTSAAVKRFQKKHGVEQVGSVGPKTLEKLNIEIKKSMISLEDDDEDDNDRTKRPCAAVPPGHLIAPGWLKKQNGAKPVVPPCQILPPGIDKKVDDDDDDDDNATTTPPVADTTAPIVSNILATSTTATSTRVTWVTNEVADSAVWYATSTPVLSSTSLAKLKSAAPVLNHIVDLTNLHASTAYYYVVVSADASKNTATSSQFSFTTQ